MAWFSYKCKNHGDFKVSLNKRNNEYPCPICSQVSFPVLKVGSKQVIEKLDNGIMVRAVERLEDVEQMMKERNDSHRSKLGKGPDND